MKRKVLAVVLLAASSLFGQAEPVTKAVTLKYPERVNTGVLDGIGLVIKRANDIVVVTGPQDRVDTAEAILHQLDVAAPPRPPAPARKNVQLTAYLIIASPTGTPASSLPKDLESAVNQVASVFPYKSFRLFDGVVMRVSDGTFGSVGGVLPQSPQTFLGGGTFTLRLGRLELTQNASANMLRLADFSLSVSIARGQDKDGKDKFQTVNLVTSIDMKEGQKVVVGKANIDGSENALIVILTAQVID